MNESYNEAERDVLQAAVAYAVAPAIAWLETASPDEIRLMAGWPDSVPDEVLRRLAFDKLMNGVVGESLSPGPQTPLLTLDVARDFLRSHPWCSEDGPPDDLESGIRELHRLFLQNLLTSLRSVSADETDYWQTLLESGASLFAWQASE